LGNRAAEDGGRSEGVYKTPGSNASKQAPQAKQDALFAAETIVGARDEVVLLLQIKPLLLLLLLLLLFPLPLRLPTTTNFFIRLFVFVFALGV